MSETLIVLRDPNIGDALMSLPALDALADVMSDRIIYAVFANRDVAKIARMPGNVRDLLDNFEPPFGLGSAGGPISYEADAEIIVLGVAASIAYRHEANVLHPTQSVMAWAGLDVPDDVPQPELNVPTMDVEAYDFLLCPWSKAQARSLTHEQTCGLVSWLRSEYPGSRVAAVGGANDPKELGADAYVYGRDLAEVVNLMRAAGVVLTVDSACNRLAHAANITSQVLLAANATPLQWQSNPRAKVVRNLRLEELRGAIGVRAAA